jgi:hypothetical protein
MSPLGKWIAAGTVGFAVVLAVVNVWYQRHLTHRTQQLWGDDAVSLVANAPTMELLVLDRASTSGAASRSTAASAGNETFAIGGFAWKVAQRKDLAEARGVVHLRHALRQDASYDWNAAAASHGASGATWKYALRLGDGDRRATFVLDVEFRWITLLDAGVSATGGGDNERATIRLGPKMSQGLKTFVSEQVASKR